MANAGDQVEAGAVLSACPTPDLKNANQCRSTIEHTLPIIFKFLSETTQDFPSPALLPCALVSRSWYSLALPWIYQVLRLESYFDALTFWKSLPALRRPSVERSPSAVSPLCWIQSLSFDPSAFSYMSLALSQFEPEMFIVDILDAIADANGENSNSNLRVLELQLPNDFAISGFCVISENLWRAIARHDGLQTLEVQLNGTGGTNEVLDRVPFGHYKDGLHDRALSLLLEQVRRLDNHLALPILGHLSSLRLKDTYITDSIISGVCCSQTIENFHLLSCYGWTVHGLHVSLTFLSKSLTEFECIVEHDAETTSLRWNTFLDGTMPFFKLKVFHLKRDWPFNLHLCRFIRLFPPGEFLSFDVSGTLPLDPASLLIHIRDLSCVKKMGTIRLEFLYDENGRGAQRKTKFHQLGTVRALCQYVDERKIDVLFDMGRGKVWDWKSLEKMALKIEKSKEYHTFSSSDTMRPFGPQSLSKMFPDV
ncbi:hypothetical protein BT69DRAFT_1276775 [Atractiella rhizophila]|nr:hypothetical protein BT69DRAFT_1276775 [Atractiella rhizophila]